MTVVFSPPERAQALRDVLAGAAAFVRGSVSDIDVLAAEVTDPTRTFPLGWAARRVVALHADALGDGGHLVVSAAPATLEAALPVPVATAALTLVRAAVAPGVPVDPVLADVDMDALVEAGAPQRFACAAMAAGGWAFSIASEVFDSDPIEAIQAMVLRLNPAS